MTAFSGWPEDIDLDETSECLHAWVGGMCYVHDEDAYSVNEERLAKGLSPLECEKCEAIYGLIVCCDDED